MHIFFYFTNFLMSINHIVLTVLKIPITMLTRPFNVTRVRLSPGVKVGLVDMVPASPASEPWPLLTTTKRSSAAFAVRFFGRKRFIKSILVFRTVFSKSATKTSTVPTTAPKTPAPTASLSPIRSPPVVDPMINPTLAPAALTALTMAAVLTMVAAPTGTLTPATLAALTWSPTKASLVAMAMPMSSIVWRQIWKYYYVIKKTFIHEYIHTEHMNRLPDFLPVTKILTGWLKFLKKFKIDRNIIFYTFFYQIWENSELLHIWSPLPARYWIDVNLFHQKNLFYK